MNVSRLIILFFIYLNWSCTVSVEKLSLSLNQNEKETENENEIEDEITQRGFLVVSQNKHFLEFENGTEFFFMGDTAYHIPSLSKTKIDEYMNDRVEKKFNAILVTANNFMRPNFESENPFIGSLPMNIFKHNEKYWEHIDFIVNKAEQYDLFVVLISAWGFELNTSVWTDPYNHVFEYGQFLGDRYKENKNVIFCAAGELTTIMGSYTPLTDTTKVEWLKRIGMGIRSKCHPKQLITIHGNPGNPGEKTMPSDFFHKDSWLSFYGNQSWQQPKYINDQILHDYFLTNPIKPTINLEPGYENAFSTWNQACSSSGTPWGQRFMAYWSVFFGSFGHTYGHERIASMSGPSSSPWDDRNKGIIDPTALDAPAGKQMQHLRNLIESKPINSRIPDQSIILSEKGTDSGNSPDLKVATRDENNGWAFIYLTKGGSVTVDMTKFAAKNANAKWYNPKDGTYSSIGSYETLGQREFTSSTSGENNDWVLVLDNN